MQKGGSSSHDTQKARTKTQRGRMRYMHQLNNFIQTVPLQCAAATR